MEGLTKQQIVLVALLISFVTSIATGIVTVALMDQAPPGVTQTINRIVERTIEKVTPSQNQTAAVVTKETVVVKEDDLVVQAIEKNTKSLVSIIRVLGEGDARSEAFIGNGLVVTKDGLIATDKEIVATILDESQNPAVQAFKAVLPDGTVVPLAIASSESSSGFVIFKPIIDEKAKKPAFTPASISDASSLKLGQTVIALAGEKVSVAVGIVSNLAKAAAPQTGTSTDAVPASVTSAIRTDISVPGRTLGGILVNLSGEVVGIRALSAGSSDSSFLPSNFLVSALASMK